MDPVKDFDIWFGAIFATIGIVAMIVGGALGVYFIRRPPQQRGTLLFLLLGRETLGCPLTAVRSELPSRIAPHEQKPSHRTRKLLRGHQGIAERHESG